MNVYSMSKGFVSLQALFWSHLLKPPSHTIVKSLLSKWINKMCFTINEKRNTAEKLREVKAGSDAGMLLQ